MTSLFFDQVLLPCGWATATRIELAGVAIARITRDTTPHPADERHAIGLPGMPNLHSHAFQRGMAGLAEIRGPASDNFWTWREQMYRFALTMTPDDAEAVAAQLYVEMLESGFTRVGEFHYLHHDHDGRPYADLGEMASRIAAAAAQTGIALTLLPVLYAHANFGGVPPHAGQRRFLSSLDQYERLLERSGTIVGALPGGTLGVAPHSLRAVTPAQLHHVAAIAQGRPIHLHVAEQTKEVDDCLAWSGQRPVAWLLDHAPVDARWCLIHATHMTSDETVALATTGAVAGLCPVTEANLGDGIFPGAAFVTHGGHYGIGTDSNVLVGVTDELRQLEYAQRLGARARNMLATGEGTATGRTLFASAIRGGARALGQSTAGLIEGAPADLVSLNAAHPALAARRDDSRLDSWIFAARGQAIDCVWAHGSKVVSAGRHANCDGIARRFAATMTRLLA